MSITEPLFSFWSCTCLIITKQNIFNAQGRVTALHSFTQISNKKRGVTFLLVSLLIMSSYPIIRWALTNFYISPRINFHSLCRSYFLQFAIILRLFFLSNRLPYVVSSLSSEWLFDSNSKFRYQAYPMANTSLLCFLTCLVYLFSYPHVLEYDFTSLPCPLGCESIYWHNFIQKVSQL